MTETEDYDYEIPAEIIEVPNSDAAQEKVGKVEFKIDLNRAMEQLDVRYKKVKGIEGTYLVGLKTKEETEEAVFKLQTLTKVTWSVKQTRKFEPVIKKNPRKPITLFKRLYGCHLSTRTRTKTLNLRKGKSRNINCPAQLIVSLKAFMSVNGEVEPDPGVFDERYPCLFEFRNYHNHLVGVPQVTSTKPINEKIKSTMCKLFNKGHNVSSALNTLFTIKAEDFGQEYKEKMTEKYKEAKKKDVSALFKSQGYKEKYSDFEKLPGTIKNLKEVLSSYQKKNGTIYKLLVKDETIVVCLCSPMMQRVVQHATYILFLDSWTDDNKECKIYFILTQTSVGALPLSCIITNSFEINAFTEGMKLFLDIIEIHPSIVMSNPAIIKECQTQKFFPAAKLLYSFYHILSTTWKALCDTKQDLTRVKKETYYQLFRDIVFSDNEEALMISRQVLSVECTHTKFLIYLDQMYENIQLWSLLYRQNLTVDGSQVFNYDESELAYRLFRLMSKIPLDRTKSFNINHMTDFICSAFEKFYRNRILEIVLEKRSPILDERYGQIKENTPRIENVGHNQYLCTKAVPEKEAYYQVDMITVFCTCLLGGAGKHCEHVSKILASSRVFAPELSLEEKMNFYFVATGLLVHQKSFLSDQDQKLIEKYHASCISGDESSIDSCDVDGNPIKRKEPLPDFETIKTQWLAHSNKILNFMENDPEKFLPAVKAHLDNIDKYASSIPMLIKGLYAGFPFMSYKDNLPPPLAVISSKVRSSRDAQWKQPSKSNSIRKPPCCSKLFQTKCKKPKTMIEEEDKSSAYQNIEDLPWDNLGSPDSTILASTIINSTTIHNSSGRNLPDLGDNIPDLIPLQTKNPNLTTNTTDVLNDETMTFDDENDPNLPPELNKLMSTDPDLIKIQEDILRDQSPLSDLPDSDDMAVFDENKGILILPLD